jgi:hypothetical protein
MPAIQLTTSILGAASIRTRGAARDPSVSAAARGRLARRLNLRQMGYRVSPRVIGTCVTL